MAATRHGLRGRARRATDQRGQPKAGDLMLLLTAKVSSRGSQERTLGTITHKGCCVGSGGHRGADRSPRRTETQLAGALRWSDRTRPGGAALLRARARELVAYAYADCSPRPAGATRCRSA